MRLLQISDLHFFKIDYSLSTFFSKQWVGNCNALFQRSSSINPRKLEAVKDFWKTQKIDLALILGDLTTTASNSEFEDSFNFIDSLGFSRDQIAIIPGNHDKYTTESVKERRFYRSLQERGYAYQTLEKFQMAIFEVGGWTLVCLDTALATPWFSSKGLFSSALKERLEIFLEQNTKKTIVLNHFPFFCNDSPQKEMEGDHELEKLLLKYPHVKLYLHGHTHRHVVADLRSNRYPIVLDGGCVSRIKGGSWNIIDLDDQSCIVRSYRHQDGQIDLFKTHNFSWSPQETTSKGA